MKRGSCFWLLTLALPGCSSMGAWSPLFSVERALLYQPAADTSSSLQGSDEWFVADDGVRLHGRYFPHPQRRAIILYCHGNAGSVESWSDAAIELNQRHQCAVFVFDYRGYGKSEGKPSEDGLYFDARAARRHVAQLAGVRETDIVLLGRSLGGGVAVELAAKDGARGLILQNTFSSLPEVAEHHFPLLLPHLLMSQRFDSISKIRKYHGPLLQCHGDNDRVIPLSLARKLHDAATGPKRFVTIPGGGHNDPPHAALHEALDEYLSSLSSP